MRLKKIFLGGTCDSSWRNELIHLLKIDYFNPVLDDAQNWDEEHQKNENLQKKECDYLLYVITPKMTGCYSIAEAVDDSNKIPEKLLFCILEIDSKYKFSELQMKSFKAIKQLIINNGGRVFDSLQDIALFVNSL